MPTTPEVERTLFDLYLSDSFVGGALANYTDEWCEVDDPIGTLEQLPNFQKERVEEVVPLLVGRIERERRVTGVGQIVCDIYTFRLVLELDPRFLKADARGLSGRLPPPEPGFSLQQNVAVAAAGEFSGDTNSAFSHRTVVGLGQMFGRFNGVAIQSEPYEVTEASAYGYAGDYELGGGFLETLGQAFSNSLQFTGAQARTSDKILLNSEDGRGSRFEIFVPSRSRVEFYRGGRLLTVQVLDFGLQEVDTTRFPQGSYDVDVVITEANGNVVRDRKFYTKSGFLSIRGRPSFDFQVGALREEFSTEDTPVYYGGVRWRAADALDIGASVLGTDELSVGQLDLNSLYRDSFLAISGAVSSAGDSGVTGSFSTSVYDFSINLGGAKSLATSENTRRASPIATPTPAPGDPPDLIPRSNRARDLTFEDRSLYSINLRRPIKRFELVYSMQGEKNGSEQTRRSKGPSVLWNMYENEDHFVRSNAGLFDTDSGRVGSVALNYRYRYSANWNIGAQLSFFDRDTQDEVVGLLTVNYDEQRRAQYSSRLALSSEAREQRSDSTDQDGTVFTNQLVADYGGDYLYGRGFVRNQSGRSAGDSSFGLTAESAVLIGSDGSTALSYPMAQEAVLIADIKGAAPGSKFEILLNDQVFDTVEPGRRSAVSVPPFKTYRVGIRPADPNAIVDYDTTTHSITFFPGNVIERTWGVSAVSIVLGRVVDETGRPIELERVRGTREYVATDEFGHFQAEITGDETLTVENAGIRCILKLPPVKLSEYFTELGDVVCRSFGSDGEGQ
jgi:outer membrane usher protein FimD/PapC